MKHLLMATSSPGVAVFFVRLVQALGENPYRFSLHVSAHIANWLKANGLSFAGRIVAVSTGIEVRREVMEADLVLVGTDYGESLDAAYAEAACAAGTPLAYFIDFWSAMEAREERLRGTDCPILVPNRHAADMLSKLNPALDVRVFGHPEFERLLAVGNMERERRKRAFRERRGLGSRLICSFFSQPYSDHTVVYGIETDEALTREYMGFDEITCARELAKALSRSDKVATLFIKPHPRESEAKFDSIIQEFHSKNLQIVLFEEDKEDLLISSDINFALHSTVLVESVLLGVPGISLQVGKRYPGEDYLVTNTLGITPSIENTQALEALIQSRPSPVESRNALEIPLGVGDRFRRFVEERLDEAAY